MAGIGRKTKKAEDAKISGLHIYTDKHGRAVYYNVFDHCGYVIDGYEKTYRTLSMRFLVGGMAAILSYAFDFGIWIALGLGIASLLFMELRFRKYLKGLPKMENFKPEKRVSVVNAAAKEDPKKLMTKILLWFALGVCLIINAYEKGYTDYMLVLNYIVAAISVVVAIVYALGFFKGRSASK